MSGTQKVQDPGPHARKYGAFQSEIYAAGKAIVDKFRQDTNKLYRHVPRSETILDH